METTSWSGLDEIPRARHAAMASPSASGASRLNSNRSTYVRPLIQPRVACGGAGAPSNVQWQTVAGGKEKDKWERNKGGK